MPKIKNNCCKEVFIIENEEVEDNEVEDEDIINMKIKKRLCRHKDCEKHATYNYEGETIRLYCKTHKKNNMINIVNKCLENGCKIRANFNFEGETKALYCNNHKKDNMQNVKNIKCIEKGCNKDANYNFENIKKKLYCHEHMKPGMKNIFAKKCLFNGCKKMPSFNLPNETKPLYCSSHKTDAMQDLKSKRCEFIGCNKYPNYNFIGMKPIFCYIHKQNLMVDVKNNLCKFEGCYTRATNKYKGYCFRCYIYNYPDEPISRNYKIKEKHMTDYIIDNYKDYKICVDKIIDNGCSKRRPDCYIELFSHVIIIECDEEQHKDYSCENKRMMEIFQDLGNRPIIFIRFNPDKYIDKNGKNIKSCFRYHETLNIPIVDNKKDWDNRLSILKETIDKNINNLPEKEVTIINLFYDGY